VQDPAASLDSRRWLRVFEGRAGQTLRLGGIPPGPRDRSPEVVAFLRIAAYCEQRGLPTLMQKSREARDPEAARCLAHHAREEANHARLLRAALEGERPFVPPGPIASTERFITKRRSLEGQILVTLVIEGFAVAMYDMIARALEPGRAAEALRSIVDDELGHRDFLAELLVKVVRQLPMREVRRLRRLRDRTILFLVVAHALGHRKYMRPLVGLSAATVRRTFLAQIERSLSVVPELAIAGRAP
jgi:rubrerythrin